jgi:hypothetical protein
MASVPPVLIGWDRTATRDYTCSRVSDHHVRAVIRKHRGETKPKRRGHVAGSIDDPEIERRKTGPPTREERRTVYALRRAGHSREAISEQTGLSLDDLCGLLGPKKDESQRQRPLRGAWRSYAPVVVETKNVLPMENQVVEDQ